MEMEKEIKEVIEKNLPKHVGEVLARRLEEADRAEAQLKQKIEYLAEKNLTIASLEKRISELDERTATSQALEKKASELKEKEINLNCQELEYRLKAEMEKTEFTKQVALGLVRNIEYRKSVYTTDSHSKADYQNGISQSTSSHNSTSSSGETKTIG